MKRILLTSFIALALCIGASAKSADQLRVYINPGHGGWTSEDRPCTLVGHNDYTTYGTDTLNFFESNTNLEKGFGVLEKLISYGLKFDRTLNQSGEKWQIGAARDMSNNIVMSRVKNGPYYSNNGTVQADKYYYDRNILEIAAEVEANNFDVFISIHSNALTEAATTNYPLFLYRGYDNCQVPDGVDGFTQTAAQNMQISKDIAAKCWTYHFSDVHQPWTYYSLTNMNIRGDINFYGGSYILDTTGARAYLGVLHHNVPGFLVEGYFHTYQPSRQRAMNWDVDRMEGFGYARGIGEYFGVIKENTGDIYGIVRDAKETFTDTRYTPNTNSDDKYKPLNGVTVILKKNGAIVRRYVTDNNYNGAFVFSGVEPGNYTLEFSYSGYKSGNPVAVTVTAGKVTYPSIKLESYSYNPSANPYAYALTSYPEEYNLVTSYSLNADATDVQIIVYDKNGKEVLRHEAGSQQAGCHTEYVDVHSLDNADGYRWAVSVNGYSQKSPVEFKSHRFYYPRSVDVDNNMNSDNFGNIYCTEGQKVVGNIYVCGNGSQGLCAFDASLNPIENTVSGGYSFMGGLTPSNNANGKFGADLQRVRVAKDGRIFVTRGNDSGCYIAYVKDFTTLAETDHFESLLSGGSNDAGNLTYNDASGNFLAAANLAFDVRGEGDNLKLLALSGNYGQYSYNFTGIRLDEYSLGNSDLLPAPKPISALTGRYTVNNESVNVSYDNRGGVWYCQMRYSPNETEPSLVYVDANGVERLKETTVVRGGGGVRVSPDGNKLAASSSTTQFTIYNISYSADGTPSLTPEATITHGIGTNVTDIAWDVANNVYICGNVEEYLKAYALPYSGNVITKAQDKYSFSKLSTGVDDIIEDKADPEYYNLLGVKISADNLVPGIYIRKTGDKTEKILIK